jgi:hypothetical protein
LQKKNNPPLLIFCAPWQLPPFIATFASTNGKVLDDLSFECLWEQDAPEAKQKVKALWRRYQALDTEEVMEERCRQVVFIVRNAKGEVGGVATARPVQVRMLNNHYFYEFRCFIAPPFRAPGLDSLLAVKSKSFLEQRNGSGSKFKGLVMVIENDQLKAQRTKAIWPASGMVFAGYNRQGHHIRVGYFKGARI